MCRNGVAIDKVTGGGKGGVAYVDGASFHVTDCGFVGNTAQHGAAIYLLNSIASITRSKFDADKAFGNGIVFSFGSKLEIFDSLFDSSSSVGGSLYAESDSKLTVMNTEFSGNTIAVQVFESSLFSDEVNTHHSKNGGWFIHSSNVTSTNDVWNDNYQQIASKSIGSCLTATANSVIILHSPQILRNKCFLNRRKVVCPVSSVYGGAIAVLNGANMIVYDGVFSLNQGYETGSVIYASAEAGLSLTNCNFNDNSAYLGGVIFIERSAVVELEACMFKDNIAFTSGGAVFVSSDSSLVDTFGVYESNKVVGDGKGGAVFLMGNKRATLVGSRFVSNTARDGGAISLSYSAMMNVHDAVFRNNNATIQGRVWGEGGTLTVLTVYLIISLRIFIYIYVYLHAVFIIYQEALYEIHSHM